jgi:hypothetical protein
MSEHGVMTTPIFDELRSETGIDLADQLPDESAATLENEEVRAAG